MPMEMVQAIFLKVSPGANQYLGVAAAWHSHPSAGSSGEKPGQFHQPMNRERGKHLCHIRKQNQFWPSLTLERDSGILGDNVQDIVLILHS